MPMHVALLRAVNVGGRSLAMADLRKVAEGLGYGGVKTLLQSGNMIFDAKAKADALEKTLEAAHLVVMFLKGRADAKAVDAVREAVKGREVVRHNGRELYITYPDGIGTSKLTGAIIEKKLGIRGTARNWNTVTKLAALLAG
jgi:uncharacterized protein (DUF1697 family)